MISFILDTIPVGVVAGMAVMFTVDATPPGWVYTGGALAFIVAAGLQFPVLMILRAVAHDDVPGAERSTLRLRIRHPFSLFAFWWRHIR